MLAPTSVGLIRHFLRAYPRRTALAVGLLGLAGLAEGVGVATVLPLLELATGGGGDGPLRTFVERLLGVVGLGVSIGPLLGVIVAALVAKALLRWTAMKQVGYAVAAIASDLRLRLIRAVTEAAWGFVATQRTGRFASAISTEAHRTAWAFVAACSALASLIQTAVYLVVILLVSWRVALLALGIGGLVALVLKGFLGRSRTAGAQLTASLQSLVVYLDELLPNVKPLKAMAQEGHLGALLEREVHAYHAAEREAVLAQESLTSFREPLIVVLLSVGLYLALAVAGLGFAVVLTLAVLFYRLVVALGEAQFWYQRMVVEESAFWSIDALTAEAERARERRGGRPAPPFEAALEVDAVTVRRGALTVLDGVSLRIEAGSFVTLVGPSGAGKTTVLDLLAGLHAPEAGAVRVDGVPLAEVDLGDWRRRVGYVPQDGFLFHESVRRNVTLGDEAVSDAAVREALEAAGAWGFVSRSPEGLDRLVGERGSRLSGGQAQRLLIARALIRRPRLLLLDEATANVDPDTERVLAETLRSLRGRVTVVAVTHQPALREAADVVVEVSGGHLREVRGAAASVGGRP